MGPVVSVAPVSKQLPSNNLRVCRLKPLNALEAAGVVFSSFPLIVRSGNGEAILGLKNPLRVWRRNQ